MVLGIVRPETSSLGWLFLFLRWIGQYFIVACSSYLRSLGQEGGLILVWVGAGVRVRVALYLMMSVAKIL
jgi:hypothetical protein